MHDAVAWPYLPFGWDRAIEYAASNDVATAVENSNPDVHAEGAGRYVVELTRFEGLKVILSGH